MDVQKLHAQHGVSVRQWCAQIVGPSDADDAVQTVWLAVWRAAEANVRENDKVHAWLRGVCRNVCRYLVRRKAKHHKQFVYLQADLLEALAWVEPAPSELAQTPPNDLHLALRQLTAEQRYLFTRYVADDLSATALAAELGLTHNAVRMRLRVIRRRLARFVRVATVEA